MVLKLPLQAARAAPVTLEEFYAAFIRIWNHGAPIRNKIAVGLAISGGVDSMALASLCVKIQHRELIRGLSFRAFVVDHGARAGSSDEAEAVSKLLLQKGLETKILTIKWHQYPISERTPNFESLARKYRFQALGRACRDAKLDALFFAHHEDDQAETVLMRLATGHKCGLSGIKARNCIPECHGIHGVQESGNLADRGETGARVEKIYGNHLNRGGRHVKQHFPMPFEEGGVMVYRPLLNFSKERLIATCLEDNTAWFEDSTNADPTMTIRNAIRHIRKHHKLPAALQTESLIDLSKGVAEKQNQLNVEVMSALEHCLVRSFQPRTGRLILRFPRIPLGQPLPTAGAEGERALLHHREVANSILKVVASSISPIEHVPLQSINNARKAIFPQLDADDILPRQYEYAFTVAKVKFERVELQKRSPSAEDGATEDELEKNVLLQDHEWSLTRQPYSSVPSQRPRFVVPPAGHSSNAEDWSLYDGRYWMRIVNRTPSALFVRPLEKEDISSFEALQPRRERKLRNQLGEMAPGNTRFTLPIIALSCPDGKEQAIALPTLEIGLPGVERMVEWEVRYKNVDGLGGWIGRESIPVSDRRRRIAPCMENAMSGGRQASFPYRKVLSP